MKDSLSYLDNILAVYDHHQSSSNEFQVVCWACGIEQQRKPLIEDSEINLNFNHALNYLARLLQLMRWHSQKFSDIPFICLRLTISKDLIHLPRLVVKMYMFVIPERNCSNSKTYRVRESKLGTSLLVRNNPLICFSTSQQLLDNSGKLDRNLLLSTYCRLAKRPTKALFFKFIDKPASRPAQSFFSVWSN